MRKKKRTKEARYQEQPWYIRVWRRRWYLLIPYNTLHWYKSTTKETIKDMDVTRLSFCYDMAIADAQIKMEWWYTMEEVMDHLKDKIK